jgi:hypothetical protein
MKRALTALALLLGLPLSVVACLWDRDTPVDEARGLPEVVAVLTGRFERNPPLFYEMRLERVTGHLQSHPEDLAAYDDAGVACDRLGRGDEAISWMEKKRAQLDGLDASRTEVKEALYRYHANLGTFLVHRWVRQGADRTKIGEVKTARGEIARALEINPNAHFGREEYQLRALEWIIDPPRVEGGQSLPNLLGWNFDDIYGQRTDPKEADDAVRGLTGLIVLGNAWESVDVFHALNVALQRDSLGFERGPEGGRNSLAYLSWLRCRELIDAGKGSMLPDAPRGEALKAMLPRPDLVEAAKLLDPAFVKLRDEAEAWQAARTAFMTGRLKTGRHPDTDRDFWDGYTERPASGLPAISVPEHYNARLRMRERLSLLVLIGIPVLVGVVMVGRSVRARRRKLKPTDDWSADAAG